jgi:hypothetical protein
MVTVRGSRSEEQSREGQVGRQEAREAMIYRICDE